MAICEAILIVTSCDTRSIFVHRRHNNFPVYPPCSLRSAD